MKRKVATLNSAQFCLDNGVHYTGRLMHLSDNSLRPIDDAYIQSLEVEALWDLSLRLLANLQKTREHLNQGPTNSSRSSSSRHAAWRTQWTGAFRHRLGHNIKTANELAEALATLARQIRDAALTLIAHESEQGPLRKLHQAFRTALIHDLSEADFADTYAQTITYGLLTAAISRTEMSEGRHGTALLAENVADIVPVTNPFLKEMLQTFLTVGGRQGGIDFDELGIQDVVELLRSDETDLPAVLQDFGNRTQGEDLVIHFYEHFLSAYNKKLKVQRGVFYTPQPVVSYIVRSVHELLQSEFGLEDGLASTATWGEVQARQPELKIPEGVQADSPFVFALCADSRSSYGNSYFSGRSDCGDSSDLDCKMESATAK